MLTNGLSWFVQVRSYYEAGASSAFILHLNVHDPPGNALSLADFLRRAFSDSHLVIEFDDRCYWSESVGYLPGNGRR